jgi:uncharacterized NAD(P)/FAD-binding protein YdhS
MELSRKRSVRERERSLRVVIVGGGFSGTLVAIHLLRQQRAIQVDLVEPRLPGRGLAYSTSYDEHLLNVPAIRMSALGSEPLHFLEWLQAHGKPAADPTLFAPRKLYGAYLQDLLEETARSASSSSRFRHHLTEADRVGFDGFTATVLLRNGERLEADKVVVASGNPASSTVAEPLPGYYPSPWEPHALSHLPPEREVLLVGAGLTAVDAFLALKAQGHSGTIYMVSRRGQLPQVHTTYRPLPEPFPIPDQVSARGLLKQIRAAVRTAHEQDVDWRAVIDSLRPVTNDIWQQLAPAEQQRVLRHLKTWWDIHRHRMAPEIGAKIQDALARRRLIVYAGRLGQLQASESGLQAELLLRTGSRLCLPIERVINCTGPDSSYRATNNAFLRFLLDHGYAVPGRNQRGLQTTAQGELVGSQQQNWDWLLTLGPPRFGGLFETTAVPELRKQAESLAHYLLSIPREPVEIIPELFLAAGI